MSDIRVSAPCVTEAEIEAVVAVLRSGRLAAGPVVERLEAALAVLTGADHAVAVSSGTAALHSAMAALRIGPGDEVVATPFSFVGSVNPVLMQGGSLRFVDVDLVDFGPDVAALESALNDRTAAVVVVDLYGQPVDAARIAAATAPRGIPVIEDSCQAIGATYRDQRAGNLFDIGCFSFYATKNVMSGEGGALITNDESLATAARRFRQHGMSGAYDYTGLGYNYRMTDVLAALAVGQLERVDDIITERAGHAAVLTEGLSGIPGLVLPTSFPDRMSAWHQYVVRITAESGTDRDTVATRLAQRGVHAAVYYPRTLTAYPHIAAATLGATSFPNAERAAREVLALPVHPQLSRAQLDRVIDAVRGSLNV